jgi:hypothetical protein
VPHLLGVGNVVHRIVEGQDVPFHIFAAHTGILRIGDGVLDHVHRRSGGVGLTLLCRARRGDHRSGSQSRPGQSEHASM